MKNVEVIKLSENQIEIDGVKYLRQEPEFKVGGWSGWIDLGGIKHLFRITEFKGSQAYGNNGPNMGKEGWPDKSENQCSISSLVLATKEEIESHLIKVAKEKGFKEGCRYNNTAGNTKVAVKDPELYESDNPYSLHCGEGCGLIYDNRLNQWAQILPSKKALPKTKKEFAHFIDEWSKSSFEMSWNDFIDLYE